MLPSGRSSNDENIEAALSASQDKLLERVDNDAHDTVPIWSWEAVSNDMSEPWSSEATAADTNEAPVEHKDRPIKSCSTNEENVNAREIKFAVKELVTTELLTWSKRCWTTFKERRFPTLQIAFDQSFIAWLSR